jgi:hypothetical protein
MSILFIFTDKFQNKYTLINKNVKFSWVKQYYLIYAQLFLRFFYQSNAIKNLPKTN